ncbi:MAG: hypothetical protein AAFZ05_02665 [Pseudomonadota bacterium]
MSAHNCLTDVTGVHVGHADDSARVTGATAILVDRPNVASVFVPGAPPAAATPGFSHRNKRSTESMRSSSPADQRSG